jgi:hypothetical protein
VAALPDDACRCLCCRRPASHQPRDSLALVLVAEESDDNPRALCATVCSMCSTTHPTDQLLADWAERLVEHYGGSDVPDHRFGQA